MPLLLPLLEWLVPMIALAVCALAYAFAAPIVNFVHTGIAWFDKAIAYLTNKAIDLGIQLTKWIAPYFTEAVNRQVGHLHQLGQLSHYAAHFAWRSATTFANFNHWLLKAYLPAQFGFHSDHTVAKAKVAARTTPFTKAQLATLEATLSAQLVHKIEATAPTWLPIKFPQLTWTPKHWREWLAGGAVGGALTIPGSVAEGDTAGHAGTGGRVVARPGPTTWERDYEKAQNKINSTTNTRLRKMNWLLAFAGAGTLVFTGLAKLGLEWLKCKNVNRLGRVICKIPTSVFNEILGLLTDILILADICQVVSVLDDALKFVEPEISAFIGDVGGALCHGDFAAPPSMNVPSPNLWQTQQIAA